jgi:hypothetical protein
VPDDLEARVRQQLEDTPEESWDEAIAEIARDEGSCSP